MRKLNSKFLSIFVVLIMSLSLCIAYPFLKSSAETGGGGWTGGAGGSGGSSMSSGWVSNSRMGYRIYFAKNSFAETD